MSAGAFAAANGILPGADPAVIKQAYQALQTGLKGTRQQNEFYEDLLRLGVTNRNVKSWRHNKTYGGRRFWFYYDIR